MFKKPATIILFVSVILAGILLIFYYYNRPKVELGQAATPGGVGEVWLDPSGVEISGGETQQVTVYMKTGDTDLEAEYISSIALRMTITNMTGMEITDAAGVAVNQLTPDSDLLLTGNWSFPINSVTRNGSDVTIDLAAINTSTTGFKNYTGQAIATFYITASEGVTATNSFVFDLTESKMMTKQEPVTDILNNPVTATYDIVIDNQPPIAISDLSVSSTSYESVDLSWTAPDDTNSQSSITEYDLRYSTSTIDGSNFASATEVAGEGTPATAGSAESITVSGLSEGQTYYFAIKSKDELNNWSAVSNVVSGSTLSPTLDLSFGLQGLAITSGSTKTATVTLYSVSETLTFTPSMDLSGGVFSLSSPITLDGSNTPGTYRLSVKVPYYLRSRIGDISLISGANTASSTPTLTAGDFDNDNDIDITDIGLLLSKYVSLNEAVDGTNAQYDVTGDDAITITDVAIILSNYTSLTVSGDEI